MIGDIPENEIQWLSGFFGGRNCLTWQQLVSGDAPPQWLIQVMPWISFLEVNTPSRPIILPVFGVDGPTEWYGMAVDEQMAAMLAEEITSVVGPSYSDFRGQRCVLSTEDHIESTLHRRFGNFVFRFEPLSDANRREITQVLSLYHVIVSRRPPMPNRIERPFGKIRGDFDRALLAGNETGANTLLLELCESGRVNAEQRKCLEIRLLAGLGRQEELARNHSLISSVMDLALPPQTITDLVEALYEVYVAPLESSSDLARVYAIFKQHIAKPYGPLFRERKGIRRPKVLRAFLLFETAQEDPNRARCEAILSAYPVEAEDRFLAQRWLDGCLKPKVEHQLSLRDQVHQAIADEDYEMSVDLCFRAIPDPWAYSALLRCSEALGSREVIRRVLDTMAEAQDTMQASLSVKDRSRLERLRALQQGATSQPIDSNWILWAQWVLAGVYDQPPIAILESAVLRWNMDEYIRDGERCIELVP